LSRERVVQAAVRIADAHGLHALTMRSLAQELSAPPMSVYHYISNKDDLLDSLVDLVFAEIELPDVAGPWRAEVRRRALSARSVLVRHPWALTLVETRTGPGPATLRHHDAMLGVLRTGGFSLTMTANAYALVDAYIYGFVLQQVSLPFDSGDSANAVADSIMQAFAAGQYPYMVEFAVKHVQQPGYDFGAQFEFGLDLILDALADHIKQGDP
jgi:AcrR family transcriptional regulator